MDTMGYNEKEGASVVWLGIVVSAVASKAFLPVTECH